MWSSIRHSRNILIVGLLASAVGACEPPSGGGTSTKPLTDPPAKDYQVECGDRCLEVPIDGTSVQFVRIDAEQARPEGEMAPDFLTILDIGGPGADVALAAEGAHLTYAGVANHSNAVFAIRERWASHSETISNGCIQAVNSAAVKARASGPLSPAGAECDSAEWFDTPDRMADAIEALLAMVGDEKTQVVLVGRSFGAARLAATAASMARPNHLVLVGPAPSTSSGSVRDLARSMSFGLANRLVALGCVEACQLDLADALEHMRFEVDGREVAGLDAVVALVGMRPGSAEDALVKSMLADVQTPNDERENSVIAQQAFLAEQRFGDKDLGLAVLAHLMGVCSGYQLEGKNAEGPVGDSRFVSTAEQLLLRWYSACRHSAAGGMNLLPTGASGCVIINPDDSLLTPSLQRTWLTDLPGLVEVERANVVHDSIRIELDPSGPCVTNPAP
jgi:pimeloyl-ACP methyl ester carboxylesterase